MAKQQKKRFSTVKAAYATAFVIAVLGITVSLGGIVAAQSTSGIYIANIENATFSGEQLGGVEPVLGGSTRLPNSDLSAKTISSTGNFTSTGTVNSFATSTATTTAGLFVGELTGTATTTLSVGNNNVKGCIELVRGDGSYARAIIDGTVWNIAAGRCKD